MLLIKTPEEINHQRTLLKGSVGLIPTMGALHEGHASLIEKAKSQCDHVVLSLFVNQVQFNNPDDFKKYPNTLEHDLILAKKLGVDLVFLPTKEVMYPDDYRYRLNEQEFSKLLCGKDRPGHFDGVLTVVMKLFQLIKPNYAYFGEKDYQQLKLIQGMVEAFFLDVNIVPCKIIREKDGLAMSSRNLRLTPAQRDLAPKLYEIISTVKDLDSAYKQIEEQGFIIDYLEHDTNGRRYVAARLGDLRLIDNVLMV